MKSHKIIAHEGKYTSLIVKTGNWRGDSLVTCQWYSEDLEPTGNHMLTKEYFLSPELFGELGYRELTGTELERTKHLIP